MNGRLGSESKFSFDCQIGKPMADPLLEQPWKYSFFQAVRLLQQRYGRGHRVGDVGKFVTEPIRFRPDTALSFSASDIVAIAPWGDRDKSDPCYEVKVTFMGLYGVTSPLPSFYSEEVLWNETADDQDLAKEFLDLVHHRLLSLLYRAWEKYRYSIQFSEHPRDRVTMRFLGLVGLATPEVENHVGLSGHHWLKFAGLLTQQPRSASGLESVLQHWLRVGRVSIRQCTGGWVDIHRGQQIQLGKKNHRLGQSTILGRQILSPASRISIHIGTVSYLTLNAFLPDKPLFHRLVALIRFFLKEWIETELIWEINSVSIPPLVLGKCSREETPRLGWNTWLGRGPMTENKKISFNAVAYSAWQRQADLTKADAA